MEDQFLSELAGIFILFVYLFISAYVSVILFYFHLLPSSIACTMPLASTDEKYLLPHPSLQGEVPCGVSLNPPQMLHGDALGSNTIH